MDIIRALGFSKADCAESVRWTGELATLLTNAGVISLVGLISRDATRKRHQDQGLPFYEVSLHVGQNIAGSKLKHFPCVDDPYEELLHAEFIIKTLLCATFTRDVIPRVLPMLGHIKRRTACTMAITDATSCETLPVLVTCSC
jgi:Adenylylsulphate kinase